MLPFQKRPKTISVLRTHNYDPPLHLLYLRLWKWQKSGDMLFAMHQKTKSYSWTLIAYSTIILPAVMIPCPYWNLQGTSLPMDVGKGSLIHLRDAAT